MGRRNAGMDLDVLRCRNKHSSGERTPSPYPTPYTLGASISLRLRLSTWPPPNPNPGSGPWLTRCWSRSTQLLYIGHGYYTWMGDCLLTDRAVSIRTEPNHLGQLSLLSLSGRLIETLAGARSLVSGGRQHCMCDPIGK